MLMINWSLYKIYTNRDQMFTYDATIIIIFNKLDYIINK